MVDTNFILGVNKQGDVLVSKGMKVVRTGFVLKTGHLRKKIRTFFFVSGENLSMVHNSRTVQRFAISVSHYLTKLWFVTYDPNSIRFWRYGLNEKHQPWNGKHRKPLFTLDCSFVLFSSPFCILLLLQKEIPVGKAIC